MQYATLEDTIYCWFAANLTTGTAGDGSSPTFQVRKAGAASSAAPVFTGTPTLLSHSSYSDGSYEIAVPATAANGFAANETYAVFCTLLISGVNPNGFCKEFSLKPAIANVTQWKGTAPASLADTDKVPVSVQHMASNVMTGAAAAADFGAELAALVETYIVNEGDAAAVMQAIADRIAADWVAGDASPLAIVAALKADSQWSNLATLAAELAKVPKSDGTVTWNATALASLQTQSAAALTAGQAALAAAVRDINNTSPATNSLGAKVNTAAAGGGGGGGGEVTGFTADALAEIAGILRAIKVAVSFPPWTGQARRLVRGDDYLAANGTGITFSLTNAGGLASMADWNVYLELEVQQQTERSAAGTITLTTGATRTGTIDWQDLAADLPLGEGTYRFIFSDASGHTATLIEGKITLI